MNNARRDLIRGAGAAVGGALAAGVVASAPAAAEPEAALLLSFFARRQTVRRYKPTPVPEEHLQQILDAARRGPTTMNQQPWVFLVVRDPAKIAAMKSRTLDRAVRQSEAYAQEHKEATREEVQERLAVSTRFLEGYFTASLYVVVLVDTRLPGSGYAVRNDGAIAAAYLMLAARALGYGTAYLTDGISEEVVRAVLRIPEHYHRVCITPIGVPDAWPDPAPKRKLEEMVAYETLDAQAPLAGVVYKPY